MENHILHNPSLVFPLLIVLCLAGKILERLARKGQEEHILPIFMNEELLADLGRKKSSRINLTWLLEIITIAALFVIWYLTHNSFLGQYSGIYLFSLGFTIILFLIKDLGLIETAYTAHTIKIRRNDVEGKLLLKKGYIRRRKAARIFPIFIILAGVFALEGGAFYAGAAFAPLAIIIGNLAFIKS